MYVSASIDSISLVYMSNRLQACCNYRTAGGVKISEANRRGPKVRDGADDTRRESRESDVPKVDEDNMAGL